jgi:SAM-dependent methyltransferase
MNQEISRQSSYWDSQVDDFDSIYSHQKSNFGVLLDKLFRWDMYARFDYTIKHASPIRGRTFLDIGCGTGRYTLEFARRGARQAIGLDISERMIAICRERARQAHLEDHSAFVQTDLLEYQPGTAFDVCIGIGLFDYIRDPLAVLKKMNACAREKVIASFPRRWTWRAPVRKLRLRLKGCDVYFYTRAQLDHLMRAAGFKSYSIERIGKLYCVTALPEG